MRLLPRMMFDDFFDDMFDEPLLHRNAVTAMRCDIREKDGSYLLDIELPGCKKEDIKMDLQEGRHFAGPAERLSDRFRRP